MMVKGVEGVTYDELGEIELANGEKRRCKVLEVDGSNVVVQLYENAAGLTLATARCGSLDEAWSLACQAICWDVYSTVWDVRLTTARKSCRMKEEISMVCL